ncbi:MAG: hypothetical protein ACR2JC_15705 [Chloroflexota bacterium]
MRLVIRLVLFILLAPLALGLLLILGVVAIVGLPLLWEQITAKWTSPPPDTGTTNI